MFLTRHTTDDSPLWAVDGGYIGADLTLSHLLGLSHRNMEDVLAARREEIIAAARPDALATGTLLPPIDDRQEVWAAGVTYLRSREARMAESDTADIYDKVYDADRVEVFFKSLGWRVRGPGQAIAVREDSDWNVPEPELTLVVNAEQEIVGYCAGNDVSSRSIEGANPLYLPQAKIFNGSCALGPGIELAPADDQRDLPIRMTITRNGQDAYSGETSTSQLKRGLEEMVGWLTRELSFPEGVFLMTGTCLVPSDAFSLQAGDRVRIDVGDLTLENPVEHGRQP